jgi:energy-coupling factor transporter ATP-binding protein EcfA2
MAMETEANISTAEAVKEMARKFVQVASAVAKETVSAEYHRQHVSLPGLKSQLYTTLEDFSRMNPEWKRVLVLGATGSGKSTLLNTLGGWKLMQSKVDYSYKWSDDTLFESSCGCESKTQKTAFANMCWFGNPNRKFIAVDTYGLDDSEAVDIDDPSSCEKLGVMATDLHNKLQKMGYVDAVVILHNDVHGNRLNPLMYTMLKMTAEKFSDCGNDLWRNVVIAYSKCNEADISWRGGLEAKKKELQASIREKIPSCTIDIPVVALGGSTLVHETEFVQGVTAKGVRASADFEELWSFVQKGSPLDTTKLQVFEGEYAKFQSVVQAKDAAERRADALSCYGEVVWKFLLVLVVLFVRCFVVPSFLAYFVLNDPSSCWDEVVLLWVCIHCIGYKKTFSAGEIVYETHIKHRVEPQLAELKKKLD